MVLGTVKDDSLIQFSPDKPATSTPKFKRESGPGGVYGNAEASRNRVLAYMTSKSRTTMLIEAIGAMGSEERGASFPAIMKWIRANYAVIDENKLKLQIKKAILKALNDGSIMRSQTSRGSLGTTGSFVLGNAMKRGGLPSPISKSSLVKPIKTSQSKAKKGKRADRTSSEIDTGLHRERKISEEI